MEEDNPNSKAGKLTPMRAAVMLMLAVIVDGVQAILDFILIGVVLNYIVGIGAWFAFYILFNRWGFSMWDAKKGKKIMLSLGGAFGVEAVTFGLFPAWTCWAILTALAELKKNTSEKAPAGAPAQTA